MAIALKSRTFSSAKALCDFAADAANNVTTIHQITCDGERFTIWYVS